MRNLKPDYIIRYWFEWKAGCFWSTNDATRERFGSLIPPEELPLSELTIKRANELVDWHDQAAEPFLTPWPMTMFIAQSMTLSCHFHLTLGSGRARCMSWALA